MPLAFTKILCPIDFDENSIAALDAAADIAHQSDAILEVLHVVPIVIQPGGSPIYVDVYSGEEKTSKAKLIELAKSHLAGIKFELHTTVGQPAAAILHAQKNLHADLIVMATHGRHGLAHFFLGSVAERVVREADCPVLTIRRQAGETQVAAQV